MPIIRTKQALGAIRLSVVVSIAAVFAAFFGVQIADALAGEGWQRLALSIEQGSGPVSMSVDRQERLASRLQTDLSSSCSFGVAESRVTVGLDLLRRRLVDKAAAGKEEAFALAENLIREAIGCSPTDGNLWYLRALLERLRLGDPAAVRRFILISARLSPYEADLLFQRSQLIALVLDNAKTASDPLVMDDLQNAIQFLSVDKAKDILQKVRKSNLFGLPDNILSSITDERRKDLSPGGVAPGSTLGRPGKYRHFDFEPFGPK